MIQVISREGDDGGLIIIYMFSGTALLWRMVGENVRQLLCLRSIDAVFVDMVTRHWGDLQNEVKR